MKIKYSLVYISAIMLCNLFTFSSESQRQSELVLTVSDGTDKKVHQLPLLLSPMRHGRSRSAETLTLQARRRSLPTSFSRDLDLLSFLSPKVKGERERRKRRSVSSLREIKEEESPIDFNKAVTRICVNMDTSTRNSLGRSVSDGVHMQFIRESDKNDYLRKIEALSKTKVGQNKMMRQLLEAYQCKCEQLMQEAKQISREEKIARDRVLQAARAEANQKIHEAVIREKKWKRIAYVAFGATASFAITVILQLANG